eukprot:175593-Rhodomonas_salina.1
MSSSKVCPVLTQRAMLPGIPTKPGFSLSLRSAYCSTTLASTYMQYNALVSAHLLILASVCSPIWYRSVVLTRACGTAAGTALPFHCADASLWYCSLYCATSRSSRVKSVSRTALAALPASRSFCTNWTCSGRASLQAYARYDMAYG